MRAARLSEVEISQLGDLLPLWSLRDGKLRRELRFMDFSEAFGFMARVALAAERLDHHTEWRNVWNRVEIELTTHASAGLTSLDIALAQAIDQLAPVERA